MHESAQPFVTTRLFKAPRELLFKAHAEVKHLAHWWSPTGYTPIHSTIDFRVGGSYHYANESPDGQRIWGKQIFQEIVLNEKIVLIQFFSNQEGGVTRHPMSATWPLEMLATTVFEDVEGAATKLTLTWQPINSDEMGNATFESARSGLSHGIGGTFDKLENYLQQA